MSTTAVEKRLQFEKAVVQIILIQNKTAQDTSTQTGLI